MRVKSSLGIKEDELNQRRKDEKSAFRELGTIQGNLDEELNGSVFTDAEDLQNACLEQPEVDRIGEIEERLKNRDRDLNTRWKMAVGQNTVCII